MKTFSMLVGAGILISMSLLAACTNTRQDPPTQNPYTGAYVPPVQHRGSVALEDRNLPRLDYVGFDANWYGGTPDYFNTSLILND